MSCADFGIALGARCDLDSNNCSVEATYRRTYVTLLMLRGYSRMSKLSAPCSDSNHLVQVAFRIAKPKSRKFCPDADAGS